MGGSKTTISESEAYLIIAFAFTLDLVNWIPIVNWLMLSVNWGIFATYFIIKGVPWSFTRAGLIAIVSPFAFFAVTAGVVADIARNRISAKLGQKSPIANPAKRLAA